MVYCLADGAQLVNVSRKLDLDATWRLSPPPPEPPPIQRSQIPPTVAAHVTAEPRPQSTIRFQPELQRAQLELPRAQPLTSESSVSGTRSVLPWLFAIVLVLAGSGVLIAWIVTRNRTDASATQTPLATQLPSPTPEPTTAANVETKTAENSDKAKPVNRSSGTGTKNGSAKSQGIVPVPVPLLTPTVVHDRKSDAVSVKKEKKKEEPKPTGETFSPVKP